MGPMQTHPLSLSLSLSLRFLPTSRISKRSMMSLQARTRMRMRTRMKIRYASFYPVYLVITHTDDAKA